MRIYIVMKHAMEKTTSVFDCIILDLADHNTNLCCLSYLIERENQLSVSSWQYSQQLSIITGQCQCKAPTTVNWSKPSANEPNMSA